MQVQFLNSISNLNVSNINKNYSTPLKNNSNSMMLNNLSNDTFVKSNDVSFKGIDKEKVSKVKQNIVEALPAVAFVGAPVLFSLGMTVALARAQNPEQIFLSDGTYFADASELRGPNDNIVVDVANNTFKMKNAGIDINPDRFDYIDEENGIYENAEKGIYINLSKDDFKYIDPENGILIDKEAGLCSAVNSDGELEDIVVPDPISFGAHEHAGKYWDQGGIDQVHEKSREYPWWAKNREQFKDAHGMTPEEYFGEKATEQDLHMGVGYGKIRPNDNRTTLQKLKDYFSDKDNGDPSTVGFDHTKAYDIFGRRVVDVQDKAGAIHRLSLTDEVDSLLRTEKIDDDTFVKLMQFANEHKLENYVTVNYPEFIQYLPENPQTFGDFIDSIHLSSMETTPNIPETVDNDDIGTTDTSIVVDDNSQDSTMFHLVKSLFHLASDND